MSPLPEHPFTAYVGIDWADTKHDICLQAAGDTRRESCCIRHQVAASTPVEARKSHGGSPCQGMPRPCS